MNMFVLRVMFVNVCVVVAGVTDVNLSHSSPARLLHSLVSAADSYST